MKHVCAHDAATLGDPAVCAPEQAARQCIAQLAYLPSSAAVAVRLVELSRDASADHATYAKVISADPALCAKLLSVVNSSWFGVRSNVTRPQVAVNLLGIGTVRALALGFCLAGLHNTLHLSPEESHDLWSAALYKAVVARHFAGLIDPKFAEEAFVAGLFQDIALPVMLATARTHMTNLLANVDLDAATRLRKEHDLFKLDHAEMGCAIAQKLHLPDLYTNAIAFHHHHASLRELLPEPLADAIFAAGLFPHHLGVWNANDARTLRTFLADSMLVRNIETETFLASIESEARELFTFFSNSHAPKMDLSELLERAASESADNTTRLVASVQELMTQVATVGKEVREIIREHDQLEEAALRDPLTGALNRQGFTHLANEALTRTIHRGHPHAVIYLDLDKFKSINDTFGHAIGDAALRHLVTIARQCIRHSDLLGRYGGDEFVIFLADCPFEEALQVAQRIRQHITLAALQTGHDQPLTLSLSIGMLWMPPELHPSTLPDLIAASDQLMYQAKRAGGNRIQCTPPLAA